MRKILLFSCLISLFACKTAEQHLEKFKQKGGKIHCDIDTVRITKIIQGKDGRDSLIYVDSIYPIYKTNIVTRWQVKFDNKRFNDSLTAVVKMYRDSLKYGVKTNKIASNEVIKTTRIQHRRNLWWMWLLIGFCIPFIIKIVIKIYKP